MPHHFGLRSKTRQKFSKAFGTKGMPNVSRYLATFKKGDYVDIYADAAVHKGMPHKYYHGRTGIVFNVNKVAIGVEMNKLVRGRIMRKRIHVRIEHVRKSRCNEAFLNRVKENDAAKHAAKAEGKKLVTKREPIGPKPGKIVRMESEESVSTLQVQPYRGFRL